MKITVKEVLLAAAQMLGIAEEVNVHLEGGTSLTGEKNTALLLNCFQSVESELALDYLPLLAEDEVVTVTGLVAYSELSKPVVRVLSVADQFGEALEYKLRPSQVQATAGRLLITYTYTPEEKTVEDDSDYQTEAYKRLLVYGVAAEYSLAVGEYTAASAWDKKYKDAVQAAYRVQPCKRIRSRRWI